MQTAGPSGLIINTDYVGLNTDIIIDYFLIRIKDYYVLITEPSVPINPSKSELICKNLHKSEIVLIIDVLPKF